MIDSTMTVRRVRNCAWLALAVLSACAEADESHHKEAVATSTLECVDTHELLMDPGPHDILQGPPPLLAGDSIYVAQFHRAERGVQTELRSVPVSGGDPTVLLEPSPSIGAIWALGSRPQEILLGTGSSDARLPTTVHSLPEDGGPARKLLDVPLGFTHSMAFGPDALYAVADSPHSLSDETWTFKVWRAPLDGGAPEVLADTEQSTDRVQLTKSGILLGWRDSGSLLAVDTNTTTDQRPGPALPGSSRVLAVSDDAVLSTSASSDDLSVTPLGEGKTKAVWPEAGDLPLSVDRAWSDGEGGWVILAEEWFDDEKVRDTLWSVDTAGRAQRVHCQDPRTATDGDISSGVAGDGAFYALTRESRLIKILLPGQAP